MARQNGRRLRVCIDFSFSQPPIPVAFLCIKAKKVKKVFKIIDKRAIIAMLDFLVLLCQDKRTIRKIFWQVVIYFFVLKQKSNKKIQGSREKAKIYFVSLQRRSHACCCITFMKEDL